MPAHRKVKEPTYTHLTICIEDYDVRCSAEINGNLYGSSRYWVNGNEPVHTFETSLTLRGICTDPKKRAGIPYEISLISESSEPRDRWLKVKDLQEHDKEDLPLYRIHQGVSHPVYAEPPSLSIVNKTYGEQRWTVWMRVTPQMVSDSLLLLSGKKPIYIVINEKKAERLRHVQSLFIQTTDPAAE